MWLVNTPQINSELSSILTGNNSNMQSLIILATKYFHKIRFHMHLKPFSVWELL